jgi:glycosyltransferase involved in cell wall biosynthesis
MKYKSIALILFDLSIIGGIQRTTIYTAKALVEAGYDVNIITSLINKLTFQAIHENINHIEKLKITKITLPSVFNFSPTTVSYIYKFLNLDMLMKKYLVINMHGDVQPLDAHLVYFHQFNIDYHFYSGDLIQRIKIMPLYLIRKKFIIKLRENQVPILVNSRWTFIEAQKFWNLKDVHILYPPAVSDKPYMPMTWSKRDDMVITITRFSPDRGLEYIYKLAEELPWVKFIIAGYVQNKDYFLHLLSKNKKNVLLCPNITEREKYELLSKGKVYLNPTPHIEGFGIAIIEGMMMGLIPVANNKGGVLDYVPTQYQFRNFEETKEIIIKALKDWTPELGKEMRTIANNFSYYRYKQDLLRILNKYYNL